MCRNCAREEETEMGFHGLFTLYLPVIALILWLLYSVGFHRVKDYLELAPAVVAFLGILSVGIKRKDCISELEIQKEQESRRLEQKGHNYENQVDHQDMD